MSNSKLIHLSYTDPAGEIRLTTYADTVIIDPAEGRQTITAIRFGGYPEMVQAMSDAIFGGGTITAKWQDRLHTLKSKPKGYRRQLSRDGSYTVATLMANDDACTATSLDLDDGFEEDREHQANQPRKCYIFCPAGDRQRLFTELDSKTAAPLISDFRDYVIDKLVDRGDLRQLRVLSLSEKMDAWVLRLLPDDQNVVQVLEAGLKAGDIHIPGATPGTADGFENVSSVTSYLNTFGVTVADRIRNQFMPLFDPANEALSQEVLTINDYIQEKAGYSLYDAQLAVAESVKRQLSLHKTALIVAECGSGKTKIGATALGALCGVWANQQKNAAQKTFNLVVAPSHVTRKWVREIGETLPDTYGMVVKSIADLNRLYELYQQGDKTVYAVFSKEKARDGYMRYPAVQWSRRKKGFVCPDCGELIKMPVSDDGVRYMAPSDQFFFQKETRHNHRCPHCGSMLWSAVNPDRKIPWVKIGGYGWVYRYHAGRHLQRTKNAAVVDQITKIMEDPDGFYPTKGACRRYPLSTYIKKKMRGKVSGFLCDELHQFNNDSGQGDAMGELYGVCRKMVGMTATLINGYSSGIFHLLYRVAAHLMEKDGQSHDSPSIFDEEYGVVENTYQVNDSDYNANRRTSKRKVKSRQLPGVSPLVFSRFLLEHTAFLSLSDMGRDLPDYEEIPVSLSMPAEVEKEYDRVQSALQTILQNDRKVAQKILSAYLNLLTVYPDQPYGQPSVLHPLTGDDLVTPQDRGSFDDIFPKEEKTLELVRQAVECGERVLVYTSWTRTDSQDKLVKLLRSEGYRTEVLSPQVPPEKREEWVEKQVSSGLQVLITNPRCVETGLDLNAFTTLIFYSMGYNLCTLRQASRRSWRINQLAPKVTVYMLYYAGTIQAKAMKLMASKLAVAGIIEGNFTEEGLAAMSDVKDMTSQMAKELMMGIKDNVEDIAASFAKMAIINPDRKERRPLPNRTAAESREAVAVEKPPVLTPVGKAVSPQRQNLYDGLLQQSNQRRKAKAVVVNEDQLTLFGFAA